MNLVGDRSGVRPRGIEPLPGTANYLLGNDPTEWHTNVPTFAKVEYPGVYPGVDLLYYGNQRQLEYDFVVAPGASARPVRLHFTGAEDLHIGNQGQLNIRVYAGTITFRKPSIYQTVKGQRRIVEGGFRLLAGNAVGFLLGKYDHTQPLVIDPVLAYSTYLGGTSSDYIEGLAVDAAGAAYVTGYTTSSNYPVTSGAFETSDKTSATAFVSKLNAAGSALVYSTYLGGGSAGDLDYGISVATDSSGAAYVTGHTRSKDFPITAGALQQTNNASIDNQQDTGFVTKLNATGTALEYSTFLGGRALTEPSQIVVDSNNNAYLCGITFAPDFPVTSGAFQSVNKSASHASWNGFVSKLNANGTALLYSTYLGGSGETDSVGSGTPVDFDFGIAIDASGSAYVEGYSHSTDFPITTGAYQTVNKGFVSTGAPYNPSITLSKLNPAGTSLLYSTYLGGVNASYSGGIAVDSTGDAYVTGYTYATDFPVSSGAFQTTNKGETSGNASPNLFVTKVNSSGTSLVYSTYLGGSGSYAHLGDFGAGITVDAFGNAYVTGYSVSSDYPTTSNAYQSTNAGASALNANAMLSELNTSGSALVYSTLLGGSGQNSNAGDRARGVALDSAGNAYIAGYTNSLNFPVTTGAYETALSSNSSVTGFVTKFPLAPTVATATPTFSPSAGSYATAQSVTISDTTSGATIYYTIDGTTPTTSSTLYTGSFSVSSTETIEAIAVASGYLNSAVATAKYTIETLAATPIFSPVPGTYTTVQTVTISDATSGATIYYTTNGTMPTTSSATYTGTLTVSSTETLEAIAVASGYANSKVAMGAYTINPGTTATPVFSLAPGTYTSTQSVTISDTTPGATIYYTTNGTTPTTSSTLYTGAIAVSSTETLKAIAVASGYADSGVATAAYTINLAAAAMPTFSPAPGTYTTTQSVTISDTTPGATIYYTTNGITPTTTSTKYTGAFSVSSTETIEAIAMASGYTDSAVATAFYTIASVPVPAATPTFSPAGGNYTTTQTVTISDSTPGATIYYTLNGLTPSTASTLYTVPITVSATETIEAVAVTNGYLQSAVGMAVYTITPVTTVKQSTSTSLVATGGVGNYTLTATVTASGKAPPTGTVSFNDTSNSGVAITTAPLNPATLALGFSASGIFKTGNQPGGVAVADLNGDGKQDIVIANNGDETISVLLGNGDGTFQPGVTYSTNDFFPDGVAIADLNGDGRLDLVISNYGGTVAVLLGNGDGTFQAAKNYAAGGGLDNPVLADFNHDGKLDIVVSVPAGNAVSVLLGNGDGSFQNGVLYPMGNYVRQVEVGDFNGDGNVDLVATNNNDNTVGIRLGNGDGTFGPQTTFAVGSGPQYALVADFNGDGKLDLAISNGNINTISILLGNGDGTFNPQVTYPAASTPDQIALADINGDGKTDLVVGQGSGSISVLLGNGDGTFQPPITITTTLPDPEEIAVADFNGDGRPDIVGLGNLASSAIVELNGQTETATATGVSVTGIGTHLVDAVYPGDTNYLGSTSNTVPLVGVVSPQTAAPVFSPAAGAYTTTQSVTISDATPGSTIYYTTNGDTPTTSSTLYRGPITVASTETIEAIAVATGYTQSPIASALYTFTVAGASDFSFTDNLNALNLSQGQSGTTNLTVIPINGFNQTVTFSCSGLPSESTCSFAPVSVMPNGSATNSVLTITTTAPKFAMLDRPSSRQDRTSIVTLALLLGMFAGWRCRRKAPALCALVLGGALLFLPMGCGLGKVPVTDPGTPAGTSQITVKAISGGTTVIQHTATLTLVVHS
ncbi:MAG: chitobiase/beta-hexosaminidase C-terminal domain-containing protein [Acidobacteriaceae bacterium]|nr:chitobiase/beta-hexosaminidase C-terminal domain-containing protein [Acidobacteriaceae bacterium]